MNNDMKKTRFLYPAVAAALFLLGALPAAAQNFQGLNVLQDVTSLLATAGKFIANLVWVASGIIIMIMLVPAAIKMAKGEAQAKDSISNVGIAAVAIFIILGVTKAAMGF
jgi:hypothetical protein